MPGENLHKFTKEELEEMRRVVRQVYFKDQGLTDEQMREYVTDYECDKLIDSLLPRTIDALREQGLARNFIAKKKFFMPTPIVNTKEQRLSREVSE